MGQALFNRVVGFISRFVVLPGDVAGGNQALVVALWVFHAWIYERLPMTPYLVISAGTKGSGKTLFMEVLSALCPNGQQLATLRPLMLVRLIEHYKGVVTLFLDEAEKLSSNAVGDLRSIFTSGAYPGGQHGITDGKRGFVMFRTTCPKVFALIGDVVDVVRDRSITIFLRRSLTLPAGDFRGLDYVTAQNDGAQLKGLLAAWAARVEEVPFVNPPRLVGRDLEVWRALWSVAALLRLDAETMGRLEVAMGELVGAKEADARGYFDKRAEDVARDAVAGVQALRDVLATMGEGEKGVSSGAAVERLKGIAAAQWRTFEGVGLNPVRLAALLRGVGLRSANLSIGHGRADRRVVKGYRRRDAEAVLAKLEGRV